MKFKAAPFAALLSALLLSAAPLAAQAPATRPAPATDQIAAPRLVIVISVDQFSSDVFNEYRPYFTGGLRRLTEGAVFPQGYQGHAATETCPGHSTILTGSRPARTGIIANTWFDPGNSRGDHSVYCAEDESVAGSTAENYTASVTHLRVPTLGEYLRRANPASRTVAIAGKDRAAIMMAGRDPNEIWWWRGASFVSHAGRREPQAVTRGNAAVTAALAQARPPMAAPPHCAARARPIPIAGGRTVGAGTLAREAGDRNGFRASPDFDAAVLAIGAALRGEMRLGEGNAPDLLILGLSASDYVGHTYGPQGQEMCLQLMGLDRELGQFFAQMDRTGIDYLVVLTADHGGNDIPERQDDNALPAAERVAPALGATAMGRQIGQQLGLTGPVLLGDGPFGDIYIDRALTAPQRARVLATAVATYRAHPQVAAVFTAAELQATPNPTGRPDTWSLIQRARASYDRERSGDFVVLLQPAVTPIADPSRGYVATHGSAWDYDRRVPILFWRRGITPFEQPHAVETADIMPSLAGALHLPLTGVEMDGRCLDIIAGPQSSCGR